MNSFGLHIAKYLLFNNGIKFINNDIISIQYVAGIFGIRPGEIQVQGREYYGSSTKNYVYMNYSLRKHVCLCVHKNLCFGFKLPTESVNASACKLV
jgi:hypothetical protein